MTLDQARAERALLIEGASLLYREAYFAWFQGKEPSPFEFVEWRKFWPTTDEYHEWSNLHREADYLVAAYYRGQKG